MATESLVLPRDVMKFKRTGAQTFVQSGLFPAGKEIILSKVITAFLPGRGGCTACCTWITGNDYYFDALEAGLSTAQIEEYRRSFADSAVLFPSEKCRHCGYPAMEHRRVNELPHLYRDNSTFNELRNCPGYSAATPERLADLAAVEKANAAQIRLYTAAGIELRR